MSAYSQADSNEYSPTSRVPDEGHHALNVGRSRQLHDDQPVFSIGGAQQQIAEDLHGTAAHDGAVSSNRLRKACDSCSVRKVKCDESGPPCRACAALSIPCTFDRPRRRRGPPNRHAEAIKKKIRLTPSGSTPEAPARSVSPTRVLNPNASFSSTSQPLSAESICPLPLLVALIDDFFTYIHPITPIVHEPSFRVSFQNRDDFHSSKFLALLAAMIAALVASFPRKPQMHLKAQNMEHIFPNSKSLVERCQKVAIEARGACYLIEDLDCSVAATDYLLGLSGAYTFNWTFARLYLGECWNVSWCLGLHKREEDRDYVPGGLPMPKKPVINFIERELGRRVFWIMFVTIKSMGQAGASFNELTLPPQTPLDPYPPLPSEVDDEYIFPSYIEEQPPNIISQITGFNANVALFASFHSLSVFELAYGVNQPIDWDRQRLILDECLRNVKTALNHVSPALQLKPRNILDRFQALVAGTRQGSNPGVQELEFDTPEQRRHIQHEIQKANIYISQLGIRSHIVEKYWILYEAFTKLNEPQDQIIDPSVPEPVYIMGPPPISNQPMGVGTDLSIPPSSQTELVPEKMRDERENIVQDLLEVIGCISQIHMEPNGPSLIGKIRQVASTRLNEPVVRKKGRLSLRSDAYLVQLLDVLMELEHVSRNVATSQEDEEDQLRRWANLRVYQKDFLEAAGVLRKET